MRHQQQVPAGGPQPALWMRVLALIEGPDPMQATTIRRVLMAFASYLVCYLFVLVCYALGMTRFDGWKLLFLFSLIVGFCGVFYGVIRSGLNRRFREPSLLFPQLFASLVIIMYGLNFAHQARVAMMLSYLFAYMFGLFQLDTRGLMRFGVLALASYAYIIVLAWLRNEPGFSARQEFLQWLALAFMTPWFAMMGGAIVHLRRRLQAKNAQLRAAMARIQLLATHDEVTGSFNRHYIRDVLEREAANAGRNGAPFSVCLIDIDFFKHVNDAHGHPAGDHVLVRVAKIAQQGLRAGDCFARYGGEEFLLYLSGTTLEVATVCAERIRGAIAQAEMAYEGKRFGVTVSIGVAEHRAGETVKQMIERADKALYRANKEGRDRVQAATPDAAPLQPETALR
ncbi:diguanylate cyclase [Oxalobacteraceae bacterium OM1]|nr:diguanylate cyclase [Oxalobacteraceae bacterium OM1]